MREIKSSNDWRSDYDAMMTEEEKTEIKFRTDILKAVIDRRFEQGLSQRELSDKMGVKHTVVARFETGVTDPQLSTVAKLFHALGLEIEVRPVQSESPSRVLEPIPADD